MTAAAGDRSLRIGGAGVRGTVGWRGSAAPPIGAEVDVELDLEGDVDWVHVVVDPSQQTGVDSVDGELMLEGVVEDFDRYGVLSLRLADGIVLIDTTGDAPLGIEGRRVRLSVPNALMYPSNT